MPPNTKSEGPERLVYSQVAYRKAASIEETPIVNNQGISRQQEADPNIIIKYERPVQLVIPYNQAVYMKAGTSVVEEHSTENDQGTSSQVEVADEEEDDPVLRITTRARKSYELDRFNKNALLIVTCHDTPVINNVKKTFERYKFEVTVVATADETITNEDWEKISQFFQQDFTSIGAVALVAATSIKCQLPERRTYAQEEQGLMQLFVDNSQLHGKPKIFISEALDGAFYYGLLTDDAIAGPTNAMISADVGNRGLPADMLYIQSRILMDEFSSLRPRKSLERICKAFNLMDEGRNVQDVLPKLLVRENGQFVQKSNIQFQSTLRKELVLDKLKVN